MTDASRVAAIARRTLRDWRFLKLAVPLLMILFLAVEPWIFHLPDPPWSRQGALVGYTFSSPAAELLGLEPESALSALLRELPPDVVRLPVYWWDVQPTVDRFDYSDLDSLLGAVRDHNRHSARKTRVILVLGVRNLGYPEVHVPDWVPAEKVRNPGGLIASTEYRGYIANVVERYRSDPLLYAWQVENEPLDSTINGADLSDPVVPDVALAGEVGLVKSLDRAHRLVVTTYNSAALDMDRQAASPLAPLYRLIGPQPMGHPYLVASLADALGLDLYVVTPFTPLDQVPASERILWKGAALAYWSEYAKQRHKQTWVMEMQASPWLDTTGFTPEEFLQSAVSYQGSHASLILLWGVEYYLVHPEWFAPAQRAMSLLRLDATASAREGAGSGSAAISPSRFEKQLRLQRIRDSRHGPGAY